MRYLNWWYCFCVCCVYYRQEYEVFRLVVLFLCVLCLDRQEDEVSKLVVLFL